MPLPAAAAPAPQPLQGIADPAGNGDCTFALQNSQFLTQAAALEEFLLKWGAETNAVIQTELTRRGVSKSTRLRAFFMAEKFQLVRRRSC